MKYSSLFLVTLLYVLFLNKSPFVNSYAKLNNLIESEIDFIEDDFDKYEDNLYNDFLYDESVNENIDEFVDIQVEEIIEKYYLKKDKKENESKNWIDSNAEDVFENSNKALLEKLKNLGYKNDKSLNSKNIQVCYFLIAFLYIMNLLF